jgi:hypothetical protein
MVIPKKRSRFAKTSLNTLTQKLANGQQLA